MATLRRSRLAEADLMEIGACTLRTWGPEQTRRYLAGLETACWKLTHNSQGVFVSRILHDRMLPARNTFGDEET